MTISSGERLRGGKHDLLRAAILMICLALIIPVGLLAQEPGQDQDEVQEVSPAVSEERDAEGEEAAPEAGQEDEKPSENPCDVRTDGPEARLDKYRREIFETVCESAEWFDGFFGSQRFDEEARRTHGRVGARLVWDEHEGLEADGDLKVKVDFPNLDHRLNAFLGREDPGDFLSGTEDDLGFLPSFFEREGEQEWLLGLGYRPVGGDRSSLDFDVGLDVDTPLDPFVRVRYRHYWLLGDDFLLRGRQTVYWTNQRDLGSGTRLDLERPIGSRTLARLSGNVVFDDEAEGADWDSGLTLYHGFSPDRAISWFVGVDGETGREVPIETYGTRFTYRQRMLREWFFGELITGVTWPRDTLDQQRELAFHVGFGFEIQFSGEDLGIGRDR